MSSKTARVALAVLLTVAAAAPAHAFRCGSRIITRGDHVEKMLQFCGEPASVQSRLQTRTYWHQGRPYPGALEEVLVEEWTYNLGPRQLMRLVRIEDGFVAEIKPLGYGY